jgi:uncharacterized protein YjbI with pentapeptide repeats
MGAKAPSMLKDVWARAKPGEGPRGPHDPSVAADLLKAVNDAASTAQTSWVFFLAQMAFFYITVASVTHKDLLLKTPVQLPLLQTQISLEFFFQWGPYVFVLLHFGLLLQHEMLARKLKALNDALASTEEKSPRSNPLRLQLSSYFFAQSMAGPPRSPLLNALMRTMTFLTFGLLPLSLLLFFQITFLPYHSEDVSWWQRGALFLDLAVVMVLGTFLSFPDRPYFEALLCILRRRPTRFAGAVLIGLSAFVLSFLAAVVPEGKLEKQLLAGPLCWSSYVPQRSACLLTAVLFGTPNEDPSKGVLLAKRSLVVMDEDLVADKEWEPEESSLLLAKRNLSYGRFDRSDLHRVDLREANLFGASLNGVNLRDARMGCIDWFEKQGCTILTEASLQGAQLEKAALGQADLRGADLSGANLLGADLSGAKLQGADLSRANLLGADLSGTDLQGASLSGARLQGADLSEANIQGADLSSTDLQGANLSYANLSAADLRYARVWHTQLLQTIVGAADTRDVNLNAPGSGDVQSLRKMVNDIAEEKLRQRLEQKLAVLLDEVKAKEWEESGVQKSWRQILREFLIDDDKKRADLSDYLSHLACTDGSEKGWIIRGIMRRASTMAGTASLQRAEQQGGLLRRRVGMFIMSESFLREQGLTYTFNGDPLRLYSRLTGPDCHAAAKLEDHWVHHLKRQVDDKQERERKQIENEAATSTSNQEP